MPIEAIASTKSTADRHVGELERRRDVGRTGSCTTGPNGITAKVTNAGIVEITGARTKTSLVGGLRDDVLLQRQLHAVGEALQQAERAVHVGADPVLHPGHDAALAPDVEQREQHQDHEDQHGLDDDEPPRVVAEGARGCRWCPAGSGNSLRAPPSMVAIETGLPAGPTRCRTDDAGRAGRRPDGARRRGRRRRPGRSSEPSGPVSVTASPAATPSAASVAGADEQRPACARCAAGRRRRPASGRRRAAASTTRAPGRRRSTSGASDRSRRSAVNGGALAVPGADLRPSRPGPARRCGSRAGVPSSSAMPASTRRSGSDDGSCSTLPNGRTRPSQLTNMPDLSVTGATGKTTSAARVTVGLRGPRGDHEAGGVDRGSRASAGSGRSARSTPPTTRPPSSPAAAAATIASPSRPAPSGRSSTPQAVAEVDAGGGVGDRTATGQQVGQRTGLERAAVTGATRDPRQLGAGGRRPASTTADSAPGTAASRSPTRITPPPSRATSPSWASASSAAGSSPGARRGSGCRDILCRPREVYGAIE